jgi:hypothetical protein
MRERVVTLLAEFESSGEGELDLGEVEAGFDGVVRGRVLDGEGNPVRRAEVWLTPPAGERVFLRTEDDGVFLAEGLGRGSIGILILCEGFLPFETNATAGKGVPPPFEFVLDRGAVLSGIVLGLRGREGCVEVAAPGAEEAIATSDIGLRGRFRLRVAPGTYAVRVMCGVGVRTPLASAEVTVEEGKDALVRIEVPR